MVAGRIAARLDARLYTVDLSGRHYTAQSRSELTAGQSVMVRVVENRGGSAVLEIIKPDIPNVTTPNARDLSRFARSANIPDDAPGRELVRQIMRHRLPLNSPRWPALHRALVALPAVDSAVIERAIIYSTLESNPTPRRLAAYLRALESRRPAARRVVDLRSPTPARIRELMNAVDAPAAIAEREIGAIDRLLDGLRAFKMPRAIPGRDIEWPVAALTPDGETEIMIRVEEDESEQAVADRVRPVRHLWLKLNLPSLGAIDIRLSQWRAHGEAPRIDLAFWAEDESTARRLRERLPALARHDSYEPGAVSVHDGLWREDE